jgi:hypothetical protein
LKSEAPSALSTPTNAETSKPAPNSSMNDTDILVDEFEKVFRFFIDSQRLIYEKFDLSTPLLFLEPESDFNP